MTTKEFANGLYKLAEQHKNDSRTIFDTDWPTVCTEAANYILELQRQLDDVTASDEMWSDWYEAHKKEEEKDKMDALEMIYYGNSMIKNMGPEIPTGVFE